MCRMVKDSIEISEYRSLDLLIDHLVALRERLPEGSDAEVRLQGDDVFGRRLSVSYKRPQTEEEMACDARYAEAYRQSRERELSKLEEELGVVCRLPAPNGGLRIVA